MKFQLDCKLNIFTFPTIYCKPTNLSRQERPMCLKLGLESASKVKK
jgi:hypothetical protein